MFKRRKAAHAVTQRGTVAGVPLLDEPDGRTKALTERIESAVERLITVTSQLEQVVATHPGGVYQKGPEEQP